MGDREWMYSGWKKGHAASNEWVDHTTEFIEQAFSNRDVVEHDKIKCPCAMCRNYSRRDKREVQRHLNTFGFMQNYRTWTAHGEGPVMRRAESGPSIEHESAEMGNMLIDLVGDNEEPPASAKAFYNMVDSAQEMVHPNTSHSNLSAIARLISIKSQYNMSIANYDAILDLIHELLPPESNLAKDYYHSKKMLDGLGMPYVKIDVCYNNCMLYWKDNKDKEKCDHCNQSRYEEGQNKIPRKVLRYLPLVDRLQRLYANEGVAKLMRSHKRSKSGKMVHPCDGEAWRDFDKEFKDFGKDPRNVRLCVATDGFTPFNLGTAPYSCWPVFVSPLNLPPGTMLKSEYIFLSLVIPGPEHPGKKLNILLQPLVDDLLKLWEGVDTWDASVKKVFNMKAAFLWSVHDFPAYGNFSGWSTHGNLACPVCASDSKAFTAKSGGKPCWFDCHRRFLPRDHPFRDQPNAFRKDTKIHDGPPRELSGEEVEAHIDKFVNDTRSYGTMHHWTHKSCFWQLEYFPKLKLRHNIDVMHNEKNVVEAVWNTCFDNLEKTKDNVKARQDLATICHRPKLHLKPRSNGKWEKPRALFCIDKDDKTIILMWVAKLMFPDGYAANIRRGVRLSERKIHGLKSHDWHIFMERLLPVAFRGFLPENIWLCLAELSFFYRQLCAREISEDTVHSMESNIAVLICKLEKIFPPGFFNPMQHLIVHLPREARLGGPVQARWMYTYEREIHHLKQTVGNKARVEGSIVESHLVKEATSFLTMYFKPEVRSVRNKAPRYDDGSNSFQSSCDIDIFKYSGRYMCPRGNRDLDIRDYKVAFLYICTNMSEMDALFEQFHKEHWKSRCIANEQQVRDLRLNGWRSGINFFDWFKKQCMKSSAIHSVLRQVSYGFSTKVASYGIYDINGYRFRSSKHEKGKLLSTTNTGVCVSSYDENNNLIEYYGIIDDIIAVTWEGSSRLELVLFECRWFDPRAGVRRTENIGLVEVNRNSRLAGYDPFILASQATLVYYLDYPCQTLSRLKDWSVVYHMPRKGYVPQNDSNVDETPNEEVAQEMLVYQDEDGLQGTFNIDIGIDFEFLAPTVSDDVTNPKDIAFLQGESVDSADEQDTDEEDLI